jgi:hypothetical protein
MKKQAAEAPGFRPLRRLPSIRTAKGGSPHDLLLQV